MFIQNQIDISEFLPELRPFVLLSDEHYSPDNLSIECLPALREAFATGFPSDPMVETSEFTVRGADNNDIPVTLYRPAGSKDDLPALLYLHGGGYIVGCDALCCEQIIRYCISVPCAVIVPDFRLAPEHPFPAAPEDCYSVLTDMWNAPGRYGIDRNRIAVTGFSCGGGLTIALCLMARDRNGPKICFQMPVSPTMDDRLNTESCLNISDFRILNRYFLEKIWNYYLGPGHETRDISEYASPARAEDLHGLPPCFVHIAEHDPHRDEAMNYVRLLEKHGVPVTWKQYKGCFHAFEISSAKTKIGVEANSLLTEKLRQAFA